MKLRLLVLSTILFTVIVPIDTTAQWVQTNGPWTGHYTRSFASVGHRLFAFTDQGMFRTTNGGQRWNRPDSWFSNLLPQSLTTIPHGNGDTTLFTAGYGGIFKSTDFGDIWIHLPSTLDDEQVRIFFSCPDKLGGHYLYAQSKESMYRSSDEGKHWNFFGRYPLSVASCFLVADSALYAGVDVGVFKSTDCGETWAYPDTVGDTPGLVQDILKSDKYLYAATRDSESVGIAGGVYRSPDDGKTWTRFDAGDLKHGVLSLHFGSDESMIFATALYGSLYLSTDEGDTWQATGWRNTPIEIIHNPGGSIEIYSGSLYDGVMKSTNNGSDWTQVNTGFADWQVYDLVPLHSSGNPATLCAVHEAEGFYTSTDNGDVWIAGNNPDNRDLRTIFECPDGNGGTKLLAGTTSGMRTSTDGGASWTNTATGLPNWQINKFTIVPDGSGDSVLLAATGRNAYRSTDRGDTWTMMTRGIPMIIGYLGFTHYIHDGTVYAFICAPGRGVFRTTDAGLSWQMINEGLDDQYIYSMAVIDDNSVPALFASSHAGLVYRSTDHGSTWTTKHTGDVNVDITDLHVYGRNLFAATAGIYWNYPGHGVLLSTDLGETWTPVDEGLEQINTTKLQILDGYLFAGTKADAVWRRPLSEMVTVGVKKPEQPGSVALHQNYPNPVSSGATVTVSFTLERSSALTLKVQDMLGRTISEEQLGRHTLGRHTHNIPTQGLKPGMYFYTLQVSGSAPVTGKMVVR